MKHSIIAGRYAEALYEEARAKNALLKVAEELDVLETLLAESKDFKVIVNTPALSRREKQGVVRDVCEKAGFSPLVRNFLLVLTTNGRLAALSDVIIKIRAMIMQERGELEVEVSYATTIDESTKADLMARLVKLTGKSVVLKENIDPSLLGGMKVLIGSRLYDASIKGRLEALRVQLTR